MEMAFKFMSNGEDQIGDGRGTPTASSRLETNGK